MTRSHRDRYGKKAGEAQALLGEAERRTADDPEWQARAAELRPAVQAALDEFALTLRLADAEGVGAAVEQAKEGRGVRLLETAREQVAATDAEEAGLVERRERAAHLLFAVLALPLGLFAVVTFWLPVGDLRRLERDYEEDRRGEIARHRAEAEARAKADFLAVMSHEIRTPMTSVLGMADLLAAADLPERERRQVDAIRSSGRHLLSIINDVLDFSQTEAGGLALERVDFRLAELLEQVRSLAAPQAVERGLSLGFGLDEGSPPVVKGDPTRLRQVLLNLVGNALKFTHQGRVTVRLSSRPEGEGEGRVRLRVEVHDTGIGIPRERQAGLFDAFTQADRSITRRYGGTGLGLAISKRLVEAMGGAIGVESAPGEGSCFWFEVPLEVGDALAAIDRVALEPAVMRPLRVLVAEDVEVNRELLGEMLGRHGHEVVFAENGAEAVALVARERFDAVLMDVHMPVMDGLEATRRIRELPPPGCRMPILGLTADVLEEERRRYLAAGMDRCLTKPVAWPELFAALAGAAAGATTAPETEAQGAIPADTGRGTVPLLAGMAAGPGGTQLVGLLGRALAEVERGCTRLEEVPAGSPELAEEAHRVKGAAGLYGLKRVGALAGEVEAAAREGRELTGLLDRLDEAVAATREALHGSGRLGSRPVGGARDAA